MNYYKLLDKLSKKGLETFKKELTNNAKYEGLMWTIIEETEEKTIIDIELWYGEDYNTEFLCSYEFDKNGNVID